MAMYDKEPAEGERKSVTPDPAYEAYLFSTGAALPLGCQIGGSKRNNSRDRFTYIGANKFGVIAREAGADPRTTPTLFDPEMFYGVGIRRVGEATTETKRTVDLTPTWAGVLPILMLALREASPEGQKMAEAELKNMARLADLYNASQPK